MFISLHQSHKKAGAMWREAGLLWTDFLPEDVDINKFVTEKVRVPPSSSPRKSKASDTFVTKINGWLSNYS